MKTNYYALHPCSYGTTVKYLGEFENFDRASEKADELLKDSEVAFWILPESDLRGLRRSITNVLEYWPDKATPLLLKANKILKRHYSHIWGHVWGDMDLTRTQLVEEAKNVLRKWEDIPFLVNMAFATELKKEEWEKIALMVEK
jgi:hypothetical protein